MARNEFYFRWMALPVRCALAICLLVANPAIAQEISPPSLSVPLEQATDIKAQPLSILSKFPSAGPALARYVAQALAKEPSAVDAVLSIIPDTSPEQASAIGAGMVRAIRALGGKSGEVVRTITYKVMLSDNKWLKTTFAAIGPHGVGRLPAGGSAGFGSFSPYPTANNAGGGAGGSIGSPLAIDEGRVGPSSVTNRDGLAVAVMDGDSFGTPLNADMTRYGMIVAIIKSDASSNGAVSTSPTI